MFCLAIIILKAYGRKIVRSGGWHRVFLGKTYSFSIFLLLQTAHATVSIEIVVGCWFIDSM